MDKNIDQLKVKIATTNEISNQLELGQDVEVLIKGSVVQQIIGDNQDGSVNITYIIKPNTLELK